MITNEQLERFKKEVEPKCGGEITETKLATFIANYNAENRAFNIYIEKDIISVVQPLGGGMKVQFSDTKASKIDAMLRVMAFIMVNDTGMTWTVRRG